MRKGHQFAHVAQAKAELIRRVTGGQSVGEALGAMGYTASITGYWGRSDAAFREQLKAARLFRLARGRGELIERFLDLIEQGYSTTAASAAVGVSTRWYSDAVVRHPVYGQRYRRLRREFSHPDFVRRFAVLIEGLASGVTITEAVRRAHMSSKAVLRMAREKSAQGARLRAAIEAGGVTRPRCSRRIGQEDVARLRRLVRAGAYMSEIAAAEGLSLATVYRVVTGQGSVAYARSCGGEPPVDLRAEGLFRGGRRKAGRREEDAA